MSNRSEFFSIPRLRLARFIRTIGLIYSDCFPRMLFVAGFRFGHRRSAKDPLESSFRDLQVKRSLC